MEKLKSILVYLEIPLAIFVTILLPSIFIGPYTVQEIASVGVGNQFEYGVKFEVTTIGKDSATILIDNKYYELTENQSLSYEKQSIGPFNNQGRITLDKIQNDEALLNFKLNKETDLGILAVYAIIFALIALLIQTVIIAIILKSKKTSA